MDTTRSFKIPYGERGPDLVHISIVSRGVGCNCVCPACKAPLVARKGPKTQHHFAHYPGANCSAETALHQIGKRLLYDRATAAIRGRVPFQISWKCDDCSDEHTTNLLNSVVTAQVERDLGPCRPDVTLANAEGLPAALLEVVVSHKPDGNVLAYAREHAIPLVEFHIKAADDLEQIAQGNHLRPDAVCFCTREKCPACKQPLRNKILHVVDTDCWRCHHPMKVAFLLIEGASEGPEGFSAADVALATRHGARLQQAYSRTVARSYTANTCPNCHSFVGDFYLHDYWHLATPANGYDAGKLCWACSGAHGKG